MIIHDNRREKIINFGALSLGETFYDPYEDIHAMKIPFFTNEDGDCNALALANGFLLCYDDEDKITPTKAKIEIYE